MKVIVKSLLVANPRKANYKFVLRDWTRLLDLELCSQVLETKRFSRNLRPVEMDAPDAKAILVVAPHPDDDTFGAGGAILKALEGGARVETVYLTNGSNDPEQARLIKRDAERVGGELGLKHHFLECATFGIPVGDEGVNGKLEAILTGLDPDAIFVPFLLDDHDDHRRASQLLMEVLSKRRFECEIWAYQIYSTVIPNVVVDITRQIERKRELMALWQNVQGNRNWAHYTTGINAANCRYLSGRRAASYAEAFFVVPSPEYAALCDIYFSNPPERIFYDESYH